VPLHAGQTLLGGHFAAGEEGGRGGGAVQVESSGPVAGKHLVSSLEPEVLFPGFKPLLCFQMQLVPLRGGGRAESFLHQLAARALGGR
jgi:hypothetical protein